MGRVDVSVPGYILPYFAPKIVEAINNMCRLGGSKIDELIELLQAIKAFDSGDDDETIGQQILNVFKNKADNETVTSLQNTVTTHISSTELDHPNGSVKARHLGSGSVGSDAIQNNAVTTAKIADKAINSLKLSESLQNIIEGAISDADFINSLSAISKAPKVCLSDLNRHSSSEDFYYNLDNIVSGMDEYFILKNDTGYTFSNSNPIWYDMDYGWYPNKNIMSDKTYLCIFRDFVDTGDENLNDGSFDVICEMGSEIIDLMSNSKEFMSIAKNLNGTWKYGTLLTHTDNTVQEVIEGTKAGDFYFNTHTYSVYYTHDGKSWNYIGNLKGSINGDIWAKLDSPKFTGEPTAPTPAVTNNSKQIATTEFVHNAIKDSEIGGDVSNNGYREISGQVVFNNVPDVKLSTPEILSQSLTITSDANPESVSISATGSVKWKGITYNATADTTFDATANHGSLDESFTNIYIKCNRAAPTQSSIVFSYDTFSVVTDEYIIIPIEQVEARYSMNTGNEGWFINRHTPIGYDDVPTDALALKSQLDEMMSKFTALENRVKALERKLPS